MIKTLQISSILAVILAGVLFVSSIVFGVHQDIEIEEFLKSPGAKKQFLEGGYGPKNPRKDKRSPLVEKAELFAKFLNPPKPSIPKINIPKAENNKGPVTPPPPPPPTAKYKLYGTAVSESDPERSIALINEPGKGLIWVRQGTVIMGTTIEQILDGKISIKDSRGKVEMTVEEGPAPVTAASGPPHAAGIPSVKSPISSSASKTRITGSTSRPGIPSRTTSDNGRRGPATRESIRSRMTSAENARLSALGDRLKAARDAKAGKTPAQIEAEDDAKAKEMIKKLAESAAKDAAGKKPPSSGPRRSISPPVAPSRSR